MQVTDFEKKRALNLIWNAAQNYDADPGFRVYDEDGRADLYWNCIIGAIWKHYDWNKLYDFYKTFNGLVDQGMYENLFWIMFENGAYEKEKDERPVFPYLRKQYAKKNIPRIYASINASRADWLLEGHLKRSLGEDCGLPDLVDRKLLDALEIGADLDTDQALDQLADTLSRFFTYHRPKPGEKKKKFEINPVMHPFLFYKARKARESMGPMRKMAFGFGEHQSEYGGSLVDQSHLKVSFSRYSAQTDEGLKEYIKNYFGKPILQEQDMRQMEKDYCTGNHRDVHLYFTNGDYDEQMLQQGFAGKQLQLAVDQRKINQEKFHEQEQKHRVTIDRLTSRIRNSVLMHMETQRVHAPTGQLQANRIWRGLYLDDDTVFTKEIKGDTGDISVDILIDSSTSQVHRTEMVSAQAYIIAESLTRCGIPVRVMGFCAMNGYTIMNVYRRYNDPREANRNIFRFYTTGANRDGLAVRIAAGLIKKNHADHRILIILSDAKPNDMIKMQSDAGELRDYAGDNGVEDTAAEVHAARMAGINVLGIFYGADDDLPGVRRMYNRDFVRIRSYDRFADTVGSLLQTQITSI